MDTEANMASRYFGTVPLFSLRREIDRLFEDTFGNTASRGSGALTTRGSTMANWTPAVDVHEDDREIGVELELPGISPEQVEISVENGILTVRGEKREERDERDEQGRYHIVERTYGTFARSFQLPTGINEEQIAADFNNGVLRVHIPKAALPQPRKIQIGGGQRGQQVGQGRGQQVEVQQSSPGSQGGAAGQGQSRGGTRSRGAAGGMAAGGAEGGADRMEPRGGEGDAGSR
jgi:HSP20 family protein